MLGHWLCVRIRAAEKALENGRLDQAYAAAVTPDVRAHRRGRKLLDGLVKPLQARARLHLQAGRHADALTDLDKLAAVGYTGPDLETLRQRIIGQMHSKQERDADERQAYAQAAKNLDAGRLETGRLAIDKVDDTRHRQELRAELDVRVQRSAQLLAQADDALNRGDVLAAVRFWCEARERHGRSRAGDDLVGRLATAFHQTLDDWFAEGRLDRFLTVRAELAALRAVDPACEEYEQMASLCSRGVAQLGCRDYAGLRQTLRRLQKARGAARWVREALGNLAKVVAAHDLLQSSPLGLFASAAGDAVDEGAPMPAGPARKQTFPAGQTLAAGTAQPGHGAPLDRHPLLMLVDGAGSSLVLPQDCVRIGRAGSSRPIDVPIPADIQSHHADIMRDGDDYFLTAHGPARVNRRSVKRTLLRDGDRVVLGSQAKFVFRQPSAKSASAVLDLSHRCRLAQDVSNIVLFRETCLIGPQPSCHLRTKEGESQVVLFDRAGQLYGRAATGGGGQLGDARPLPLGETLDFSDQRVTVKAYEEHDSGRRA